MASIFIRDEDDVWIDVSDRVPRDSWEVTENAEEGSVAMSTLILDDPDQDYDTRGHRHVVIIEPTSEADDILLFAGMIADQAIARANGDWTQKVARVWQLSLTDANTQWSRRVMTGTDSKRPAETDVERMQWLLTGNEAYVLEDVTTYVSTANPVQMDAVDYRGQMFSQVADDCAQASGKNWWLQWIYDPGTTAYVYTAWYGKDSLAAYASPLSLSNDPADWVDAELDDGTSLVWPIALDTTLKRDPSRVFSGVYLPYEGGAVLRHDLDTRTEFATRDVVMPQLNVKSKAKAVARVIRYLDDLDEQDERITTAVELPAAKGTMIRAGMRISFKATHLPGYETGVDCRVLSCTVTPIAAATRYRLTLELTPVGATVSGSCSTVIAAGSYESATATQDTSPTVGITPASNTVLIAALIGCNGDSPPATNMTAITGGYTEILDEPGQSRKTFRVATKAATGGILSTAAATFASGFGDDDIWLAVQIALPMTSETPVQTKYAEPSFSTTLDAPPTPGNIVLVFAFTDSGSYDLAPNADVTKGPTTGWVELFNGAADTWDNSNTNFAVFARCVETGETGEYAYDASSGYTTGRAIFIAEFAP